MAQQCGIYFFHRGISEKHSVFWPLDGADDHINEPITENTGYICPGCINVRDVCPTNRLAPKCTDIGIPLDPGCAGYAA